MEPSLIQWAILNLTAFMYGFSKTGIVGSAVVCTPIMLLYFTPGQTLGIILPLLVVADVITIILLRRSSRWNHVLKAMPWAIIGIVIGWLIARHTVGMTEGGDAVLRKIIALALITLMLLGIFLQRRPDLISNNASAESGGPTAKSWFACTMGILGGVTTMLANNGGPAWVVYLMSLKLTVKEFLGTTAWLFFTQNLTKVPFGISLGFITRDTLSLNVYLLPALFLGIAAGGQISSRLSKRSFDIATQILVLAGSVYLLFS